MNCDLDLLLGELTTALTGLSAGETQAVPTTAPQKWSIQEIVEHLHLTYSSTIQVLASRIEKERPTLARATAAQHIWRTVILRFNLFPSGRKAPAHVTPTLPLAIHSGDELLRQLKECLMRLDNLTLQGQKIFMNQAAVSHAILGPLTMAEWRRFHLVHGRHHLKQIRAIRQSQRS